MKKASLSESVPKTHLCEGLSYQNIMQATSNNLQVSGSHIEKSKTKKGGNNLNDVLIYIYFNFNY